MQSVLLGVTAAAGWGGARADTAAVRQFLWVGAGPRGPAHSSQRRSSAGEGRPGCK